MSNETYLLIGWAVGIWMMVSLQWITTWWVRRNCPKKNPENPNFSRWRWPPEKMLSFRVQKYRDPLVHLEKDLGIPPKDKYEVVVNCNGIMLHTLPYLNKAMAEGTMKDLERSFRS